MDMIYDGQLPPGREILGNELSQFPPNLTIFYTIFYMAKFHTGESP